MDQVLEAHGAQMQRLMDQYPQLVDHMTSLGNDMAKMGQAIHKMREDLDKVRKREITEDVKREEIKNLREEFRERP